MTHFMPCRFGKRHPLCFAAAVLLAVLACPSHLTAGLSQTENFDLWMTDGGVADMVQHGSHTYIGGGFTYTGPRTGSGAVIDLTTNQVVPGFPRIDGVVECAIADGAGGWFIGGAFLDAGGIGLRNLVHVTPGNAIDLAFNPDPDGPVYALLLHGSELYVGGAFGSLSGGSVWTASLAKINADATHADYGKPVTWASHTFDLGDVHSLCLDMATLYVGGDFRFVDGVLHGGVVALDGATGTVDHAFDPEFFYAPAANAIIRDIAVSGGRLYAAGRYLTVDGAAQRALAALTLPDGELDVSFAPQIGLPAESSSAVGDIMVATATTTAMYIAGHFSNVNGVSRSRAAALDMNGTLLSFDPNATLSNRVNALVKDAGTVYLAGDFHQIGDTQCNCLAAVDASGGQSLAWDMRCNLEAECFALQGQWLFVGGQFNSIGGVQRNHLARIESATGAADTTWVCDTDERVTALAVVNDSLFITGYFTNVDGVSRKNIAAVDLLTDAVLAAPNVELSGGPGGRPGNIDCMCVIDGVVYCGGSFGAVGAQVRGRLAAFDANGSLLSGWKPSANGISPSTSVCAMAAMGTKLIVGGNFSGGIFWPGGSASCANLGAIECDATSADYGQAFNWAPQPDNAVGDVGVTADRVFFCGDFGAVNGTPRERLAAVMWPSGDVAANWDPDPSITWAGFPTCRIEALAILGDNLLAGGRFGEIGGAARYGLAAIGINDTHPDFGRATRWTPDISSRYGKATGPNSLHVIGGALYVSGYLGNYGGKVLQCFASYFIAPEMETAMLSGAAEGAAYSATLTAQDAAQAVWSVSPVDALPPGLSFDAATATISGTPQAGTGNKAYVFTVQVQDAASSNPAPYDRASREFTLFVSGSAAALPFSTGFEHGESCPGAVDCGVYGRAGLTAQAACPGTGTRGLQLDASPGSPAWALQPAPPGAGQDGADDPARWASDVPDHVSALSWAVDGSALAELNVEFDWCIVNAQSDWYANLVFEINDGGGWRAAWGNDAVVSGAGAGLYRNSGLPGFLRTTIRVTGINPTANLQLRLRALTKFSLDDLLPSAVFIDNLSVTDSSAGGVPSPLAIATTALPPGQVDAAYAPVGLLATGGAAPYNWSIVSGALPGGLSLAGDTISGTPLAGSEGDHIVTVQVYDNSVPHRVATATLTVSIAAAPVVPPAPESSGSPLSAAGCALSTTNRTPLWAFLIFASTVTMLTTRSCRARPDRDAI